MLQTATYTLEDLLRERREGAVRAIIRAVGYALHKGGNAEEVGRFWFQAARGSAESKRIVVSQGQARTAGFIGQHLLERSGWCDNIALVQENGSIIIESDSMLTDHEDVLGFHAVTRMDMEACMETVWRSWGRELGLEVTYTIGDDRDWMIVRAAGGGALPYLRVVVPEFTPETLAAHRRHALAAGIILSIGMAKRRGSEPEDLGLFFYNVWESSGHYAKLRDRFGFGNALAYAQSLAQSRQVLYESTTLEEDLDGYTISSPSWYTEIPQVMATYGIAPDDVYRYFAGGGIAACARLGLQYADQSDQVHHRVWIRSR